MKHDLYIMIVESRSMNDSICNDLDRILMFVLLYNKFYHLY